MNTVLIYAAEEYLREMVKSALINHLPLIITENREQCLEALKQKTAISTGFISACSEDGNADLGLFEEILALRPGLHVMALGDHNTEDIAAEAVRHGAAGYILMPAEANAILTLARETTP
jgi:DNA-binding NtrC family response regulator